MKLLYTWMEYMNTGRVRADLGQGVIFDTDALAPRTTGWRSLPLQAGVTGTLLARRAGDQVWLRLVNVVPPAGSYAVHIALLPASLAPDGEWFFIAHDESAGSPPSVYGMASGNLLTWQRTTTHVATRPTTPQSGSILYSTKAAFPASTDYPGTPA